MTKKSAQFAATLLGAALCAGAPHDEAAAAERGFYLGGHAGQSSKDVPRSFYELFSDDIHAFSLFTLTQETASLDDSDTALGLIVGYRLTRYLAFEAGYMDLGEVSFTSRGSGSFPLEPGTNNVRIKTETTGFNFAAIGVLPLSRDWELFARAGVLFADNKIRISIASQGERFIPPLGTAFSASDSQGTTDLYAGLGVSRRFFEIYDLRLEYQRAFDAGDADFGGKGDLDAVLLGLVVTF